MIHLYDMNMNLSITNIQFIPYSEGMVDNPLIIFYSK
jgi:hypothetical protein